MNTTEQGFFQIQKPLKITYTGTPSIPIEITQDYGVGTIALTSPGNNVQQEYLYPQLISIKNLTMVSPLSGISAFSIDNLEKSGAMNINQPTTLTTIAFPSLLVVSDGLNFVGAEIDTIFIPNIESIATGGITLACPLLITFSIPKVIYSYGILDLSACPLVTNLTIGDIGVTKSLYHIEASGTALSEASVNAILATLVSLDGTNGTIEWKNYCGLGGGTSSAPTGQGLLDKATLIARGATVTTN